MKHTRATEGHFYKVEVMLVYFITQELCDEVAMYLSLTIDIDVRIVKNEKKIEISGGTDIEQQAALEFFLGYIRGYFRDADVPTVSMFHTLSFVPGSSQIGEAAWRNFANN
jgi:hypothetical protein